MMLIKKYFTLIKNQTTFGGTNHVSASNKKPHLVEMRFFNKDFMERRYSPKSFASATFDSAPDAAISGCYL